MVGVAPLNDIEQDDDEEESDSPLVTPLSSFQGSPSTVDIPTRRFDDDDDTGLSSSGPSNSSSTASFESFGSAIPASRPTTKVDDGFPTSPTKFFLEDSLGSGLREVDVENEEEGGEKVVESTEPGQQERGGRAAHGPPADEPEVGAAQER